MNAAVGPRKVSARERAIHNTAIAIAVLLSCAPLAWSQNPSADKASGSAAPAGSTHASGATHASGSKEAAGTSTTTTPATAGAKKAGTAGAKGPASEKSQVSYSLGVTMGDQLHHLGLSADSISSERLMAGLRDALAGKVTATANDQQNIGNFIKAARNNIAETNRAAAKAFLSENGKKKDVVTTASGLQYHIDKEGEGSPPKSTDEVTVNYRGTLLDGTEFDSSYKRGTPASFPVNGVIPGWQEALVLMKPGSKWDLFIPPNLAYDVNSPPAIPPGSLLKFEVELLKVKQPAPAVPGAKVPSSQ
jgi:FKBP-type peptidyl-prolyl cis-trans isomerase FklB